MKKLVPIVLLVVATAGVTAGEIDYAALYGKGVTFSTFVDSARSRAAEWRRNSTEAIVQADMLARVRDMPARRRLLVVAEPSCSDSIATLPYLAKLVEQAPDKLELRIVDSKAGRPVMEAHRTPDGRAATPTVAVMGEDGQLIGTWSERPAALQAWYIEQKSTLSRGELFSQKTKWYADDGGKSAVAEIVAIVTKQP